jgi:hypothetical protein
MTTTLTPAMTLAGGGATYGNPVLTVHDRDADVDAVLSPFTVPGLPNRRWRLMLNIDSTPLVGKGPAQIVVADTGAPAVSVTLNQPIPYVRVKDIEAKVAGTLTCHLTLEWLSGTKWVPTAFVTKVVNYAAPSPAQTDLKLGINVHLFSSSAPAEFWRPALDAIVASGATWVRTSVPWAYIENGGKGNRDPNMVAMLDTFMTDAGSRGLKVLMISGGATPDWAAPTQPKTAWTFKPLFWNGTQGYGQVNTAWQAAGSVVNNALPPANWQDFADYVTWFVGRYANGGLAGAGGTALGAVENMNEPYAQTNQTRDPGNNSGPMAATPVLTLAQWQQHLYSAAKAAKSTLTVIGLVSAHNDWALLQHLYDTGAFKGNYDALSVHPYPVTFRAPLGTRVFTPRFPFGDASTEWHHHPASIGYFIDVMAANNDPAAVWVTEFGQSSGDATRTPLNVSPAEQADHVAYMWKLLARYPKVDALFMHSAEDKGSNYFASSMEVWDNFGITGVDHATRKPAFAAVQAAITAIKAGTG